MVTNASNFSLSSVLQLALPDGLVNWTEERLEEIHTIQVKFFCDRKPHTPALLKRIQCPIRLIHCTEDIAYPINFVEEVYDRLQDAGVNVQVACVRDAPHFGSVTHFTEYVI